MSAENKHYALFGLSGPKAGSVIDLSEHGRVGNTSSGQGFKFVSDIDATIPTEGNNPSITLGYTGDNLTTITKTINGVQYQKTLTYSGSNLTAVSAWVEL